MPGIVGLVTSLPRERAERELRHMVEALRHESFYDTGTWIDASLGIYVGWCARRHPFSDRMPLHNERGDLVLIFSGEEFAAPGTARRLREQGHTLDLEGPDYLVHMAEDDASFPAGLNGRFHGLLVDQSRRTATLFNDRYGMHRVYYHESSDGFYFAAEAKAILAVRRELRRLDPRRWASWPPADVCSRIAACSTGFRPPRRGQVVLRDGAAVHKASYFEPRQWESQAPLEPEDYYRELRDASAHNLPRYFGGREAIGVSLTGGLDTRLIMAQLAPTAEPCPATRSAACCANRRTRASPGRSPTRVCNRTGSSPSARSSWHAFQATQSARCT